MLDSPLALELSPEEVVQVLLDMSQAALTTPAADVDPDEDDAGLEFAKQALESAGGRPLCEAKSFVQIGICHWAKQQWAEGVAAFEAAQALNQESVWTVQDDVMLWHCKRKLDIGAEKRSEEERTESGESSSSSN